VIKTVSVPPRLRQWLDGDLLLFSKGAVWAELLAELTQGANGQRNLRKGLLAIAALLGAIALWHWNGGLMVALLVGSSSGIVLYWVLGRQSFSWRALQNWLKEPQAPLGLSVGAGAGVLVLSYSALAVWHDLNSPWLALMLLMQEIGILLALGLAVGLMLTRKSDAPIHAFDRCVAGLLHRDELRRLMAVRQLANLATQAALTAQERSLATEYLHLLARKETDLVVTTAIQESLMVLAPAQQQLSDHSSLSSRAFRPSASRAIRQKAVADSVLRS
jgi:hypothetical protein